jgi:hypothetical protein
MAMVSGEPLDWLEPPGGFLADRMDWDSTSRSPYEAISSDKSEDPTL